MEMESSEKPRKIRSFKHDTSTVRLLGQHLVRASEALKIKALPTEDARFTQLLHGLNFYILRIKEESENNDKSLIRLPRQYLPIPYGRICYEGFS